MVQATNKALLFIFKIIVSSVSLYIVFSKADIGQIAFTLRNTGPFHFFSASIVYSLSQLVSALRWKLILPYEFTVRRLFSLNMIGAFFSTFLPGVIGGDAVKAYYLNKKANKMSITLASVFLDRYLGYASLIIIGISAFPFALGYFGNSAYKWVMPLIFIVFITGSFLFFGLQIGAKFSFVSEFYAYFLSFKTKKSIIVKAIIISFIIQFMNIFMVILLASGMGLKIPFLSFLVFMPIVITITTIPISIAGLGIREGSFVLLLGLLGVGPEAATSLSLVWFFTIFAGSLPGLIIYISQKKKGEKD